MKAYLILADGTVFTGESIGKTGTAIGEIVFNTSMTGYQEVLTDPSYAGQIVTMTYPMIGNYGVNDEDNESDKSYVKGFVVRQAAENPNNYRCSKTIEEYLKNNNIVGIQGIDTRQLTVKIRSMGAINAMITTQEVSFDSVCDKIRAYRITNPVDTVTGQEIKTYDVGGKCNVALIDLGLKKNIIRSLLKRDVNVTVYPAETDANTILNSRPDGIMLSNGPGDPTDCKVQIETIKSLINSGVPIFGICLGHQLTALAMGFKTEKLKFGHRGANHPVLDTDLGRTYITSQNHGYAVTKESVDPKLAYVSHINQNDGTVEGIRYKNKNIFTVQFHPEAAPGPMDTAYLFDEFVKVMGEV